MTFIVFQLLEEKCYEQYFDNQNRNTRRIDFLYSFVCFAASAANAVMLGGIF